MIVPPFGSLSEHLAQFVMLLPRTTMSFARQTLLRPPFFLFYSSFDMTNRGGISKKIYLEDKIDTRRKVNWSVEYL